MYKLRFFFDAGSGICFWAGDSITRDAYGYAIEVDALPLTEPLRVQAQILCTAYDTCIDWNNPVRDSLWSNQEKSEFSHQAHAFLTQVQQELGDRFEIVNEAWSELDQKGDH